jgi:hypothetical protein
MLPAMSDTGDAAGDEAKPATPAKSTGPKGAAPAKRTPRSKTTPGHAGQTQEDQPPPGAAETSPAPAGPEVSNKSRAKTPKDWFSPAVALVGVIVAFVGGIVVAYVTTQAQRDQAIESFRRDQRQTQYAVILQQATRLQNAAGFSSTAASLFGTDTYLRDVQKKVQDMQAATGTGASPPPDASGTTIVTGPALSPAPGPVAAGGDVIQTDGFQQSGLSGIRDTWQTAYTGLDQAISNAEIASSAEALNYARALRDKYRDDYFNSILKTIESKPPVPPKVPDQKLRHDPTLERLLADTLVGVPRDTSPRTYDLALLNDSTDELTKLYVQAAKTDLGLDDR